MKSSEQWHMMLQVSRKYKGIEDLGTWDNHYRLQLLKFLYALFCRNRS